MYIVFIHDLNGIAAIGGVFSTEEKALEICREWNKRFGCISSERYAGYNKFELDSDMILNISFVEHD